MAKTEPSVDQWLREAKADPAAAQCGMLLTHNETAEVRDDHLFIGGVDMVEMARKEGTALYVFDEADLRHRMEA